VPELARGLDDASRQLASRHAVASCLDLRRGKWLGTDEGAREPGHLGLLVVDGFLAREVHLGDKSASELVGRGDLLRPADHDGNSAPVPFAVSWEVLAPARLAVIDRRVATTLAHWPEIVEQLVRTGVRRAQTLGLHLALCHLRRVEPRLEVLLWHLADRWGTVTPEGVHVPLKLTHRTLAMLVGAQRPSVTTALQALARDRRVTRRADGTWTLHGAAPDLDRLTREAPAVGAIT
jgi:CRP-like cAMP-binding protein